MPKIRRIYEAADGTQYDTLAAARDHEDMTLVPGLGEYLSAIENPNSRTRARNCIVAFQRWAIERDAENETEAATEENQQE